MFDAYTYQAKEIVDTVELFVQLLVKGKGNESGAESSDILTVRNSY